LLHLLLARALKCGFSLRSVLVRRTRRCFKAKALREKERQREKEQAMAKERRGKRKRKRKNQIADQSFVKQKCADTHDNVTTFYSINTQATLKTNYRNDI